MLAQYTENQIASYLLNDLGYRVTHPQAIMVLSRYLKEYYPDEALDEELLGLLTRIEVLTFEELNERDEMHFQSEQELVRSPYYGGLISEGKLIYEDSWFIIDSNRTMLI